MIINNFIRKIYVHFFLNIKKGHKKFCKKKEIYKIRKILFDFSNDNIQLTEKDFNKKFFSNDTSLNQKILKQKFLTLVHQTRFLHTFYYFNNLNTKGIYCLPNQYLSYLKNKYDQKINFFFSRIYFKLFILLNFFLGLNKLFKIFIHLILINLKIKKKTIILEDLDNYDIFTNFNLEHYNISNKNFDLKGKNIINWVIKKFNSKNIILVHKNNLNFKFEDNGIKIVSSKNIYELLINEIYLISLLKEFFLLIIYMTKDLLMMKWWNVIFFSDVIDYKLFEFSKAKLARNYYFITDSNNYKPIWAYVVEKKNSKIILLSISVQTEINSFECYDYEGICSSTWKHYYPWNPNHRDYIFNKLSDKNVNINVINSYIPYKDSEIKISLPDNTICFFDYQNHKKNVPHSTLVDYALAFGDGTARALRKKFCLDLISMKKKFNFNMVTKKKRNIDIKLLFKKDLILDKYLESNQVIFIDPNVAVERIIKKTKLAITLPFTSPAVIAQNVGVESIYYDPICNIDKNDPNRSNILIISGLDELKNYLENFFKYKL